MSLLAIVGLRTLLSSSREGDAALADALRRFHDGADRGELKALLCEAWGPSPPVASDLRGLAARESMREPAPHVGLRCVCEDVQIPDCEPCPCDCHGPPT